MAAAGKTFTVTASTFGGPGDPGTGSTGYRGDNLNAHPDSFAELSNPGTLDFSALGNLPHGTAVTVTNPANGRSMVLYKRDVGRGGGGIGGTRRGIDLWYKAAQQLGVNGLGVVKVTIGKVPGQLPGKSSSSTPGSSGSQSISVPGTAFDQAGFQQAQNRYLVGNLIRGNGKSPYDFGPQANVGGSNALFSSGLLPTSAPNPGDFTKTVNQTLQLAHNSLQQLAGHTPLSVHPGAVSGKGYVNPISGASIGRTDMGVDASLPNGHPIRAIGDSKVIGTSPNWYKGQPYVLFQFVNGPSAGKYYYIAEAINPTVHSGQLVHAGDVVGTFNSGGTGLELGWGSPTPGRTLAQATTGYHEGQVTPAGVSFRQFLSSLH